MASKIKNNDPCPCGSGLKYKKCCFGEDEQIRTDVALLDFTGSLQNTIGDNSFTPDDEIKRSVKGLVEKQNQESVDDFNGLSPELMHRFIHFPFESPQIVTFSDLLSVDPQAPVMILFKFLTEAIGEQGLKATAKGNLPRQFCLEAVAEYKRAGDYMDHLAYVKVQKEEDFSDLNFTRVLSETAGLIRTYKGKFMLSRDCKNILDKNGMAGVYTRLFKTYAVKLDWGFRDGCGDIYFIQRSFLYSLYLLELYGDTWKNTAFYEDCFLKAFPGVIDEVPVETWISQEKQIRQAYSWRTLNLFAGFMGLIELEALSRKFYATDYRLKKLPLLGQALKFHLNR